MITLYHGSNMEIGEIDFNRSKKGKDFGRGFYLNADRQQAEDMAIRTTKRLKSGTPTVTAYQFDDSVLNGNNELSIKRFDDYSLEWADFVVMNRRNKSDIQAHNHDIVIGPIADDTVGVQVRRYMMGYIGTEEFIEELRYHGNHAEQYFFGTEKAISLLKKIDL